MKPINVLLVGGPLDGKVIKTEATAQIIRYALNEVESLRAPTKKELEDDSILIYTYQIHPIVGNRETWHIGRVISPMRQSFDDAIEQIIRSYADARS